MADSRIVGARPELPRQKSERFPLRPYSKTFSSGLRVWMSMERVAMARRRMRVYMIFSVMRKSGRANSESSEATAHGRLSPLYATSKLPCRGGWHRVWLAIFQSVGDFLVSLNRVGVNFPYIYPGEILRISSSTRSMPMPSGVNLHEPQTRTDFIGTPPSAAMVAHEEVLA